jgi:hypothetical protein
MADLLRKVVERTTSLDIKQNLFIGPKERPSFSPSDAKCAPRKGAKKSRFH